MTKRTRSLMVLDERQRDVYTRSPVRLEIIDAMSVVAPCSVAELATELGRTPQSLYYHIKMLVDVGMIVQTATRKAGKRDEAVYDLPSGGFRIAGTDDPDLKETSMRLTSTILKLAERNFKEAWDVDLIRAVGASGWETAYVSRRRVWLTDEDLLELYDLLGRVGTLLSDATSRREGQPYAMTNLLIPLTRHEVVDDDDDDADD